MSGIGKIPSDQFTTQVIPSYKSKAGRLVQAYQSARAYPVMQVPPTITVGASGGASPITSPVAVTPMQANTFPVWYPIGGGISFQVASGAYPNGNFPPRGYINNSTSPSPYGWGTRIRTYANTVAIHVRNTGDGTNGVVMVVRVNGEYVSLTGTSLVAPGDGNFYWVELTFADAADRTIDFIFNNCGQITGFNLTTGYVALPISPADFPNEVKIGLIGDSYVWGKGPVNPQNSVSHAIAEYFGWQTFVVPTGVGGIGYNAPVSSTTLIGLVNDLTKIRADYDMILFEGVYNDANGGYTSTQVQTAATAFATALLAAYPGTPLIGIGGWRNPTLSSYPTLITGEQTGLNSVLGSVSQFAYLDAYNNAFQNPATTANYASDNVHPSDAGGKLLGQAIAAAAYTALQNMITNGN